ncbi:MULTISPECIES: PsiF family protein [Comamonadaceae]|uniref:PsiF family protein n=1 Tax=Comamonadaceae TaxID=80864 RepID=UPI002ABB5423|nr:PsiF family protein [Rhodoferax sp.]MDZ4206506.1 PsiF family protein [Rhodoferax sp.]
MRKFLTLLGLTLSLGLAQAASPATPAKAASAATPATPAVPAAKSAQQNKMKTCNKEAADKKLKGDERKVFMKSCLSNKG